MICGPHEVVSSKTVEAVLFSFLTSDSQSCYYRIKNKRTKPDGAYHDQNIQ